MYINRANMHFLGKDGLEKKNCAQAILMAFQGELNIPDSLIDTFKAYGGGRAPNGVCGAAYAAEFILGMAGVIDDQADAISELAQLAGSANCKEIKEMKKLSCLGCVEKMASYLQSVIIGDSENIEFHRVM